MLLTKKNGVLFDDVLRKISGLCDSERRLGGVCKFVMIFIFLCGKVARNVFYKNKTQAKEKLLGFCLILRMALFRFGGRFFITNHFRGEVSGIGADFVFDFISNLRMFF